jgi:hypothetical protein
MDDVLELVTFKTLPGVTDEQVVATADALQRDVEPLEGYRARRLLKAEDGTWVDTVRWTSMAAAHAAAEVIESKPSAQAFMEITDVESIRMLHAHPLKDYPPAKG